MQKHTIGYVCPGPMLLRWYCVYVLVIALNGITECFVTATMSQQEVNKYNRIMIGLSLLFLFSALALTRLAGSVGFIWANCLNMMARITHRLMRDSSVHSLFNLIFSVVFILFMSIILGQVSNH
jgi:oligosaccharide translocation protein RFT1